jgi:hypothetical protein
MLFQTSHVPDIILIRLLYKSLRKSNFFIFKDKVKFTLEQAMKAQSGSRGIALLFL